MYAIRSYYAEINIVNIITAPQERTAPEENRKDETATTEDQTKEM